MGQGREKNMERKMRKKQINMNATNFLFLQEISSSDYSGPINCLGNVDIIFSYSIILEFCAFKLRQFKFYSTAFYNTHCSGLLLFHYFIKYIPIDLFNLRPCLGYSFWDRVFLVIFFLSKFIIGV